ncbi:MAG: hypothetical protein U9Q81_05085 [Pseudomonadota bacterium]|nr:hypothetical protein [Pseudomonadota bacterium]
MRYLRRPEAAPGPVNPQHSATAERGYPPCAGSPSFGSCRPWPSAVSAETAEGQSLSQADNDPTAFVMAVQIQDIYYNFADDLVAEWSVNFTLKFLFPI